MALQTSLPVDADLHGLTTLVRGWTLQLTSREGVGKGSGVVWHPEGLMVTNAPVVGDSRRVRVRFGEKREGESRVLVRVIRHGAVSAALPDAISWAA